MWSVIHNKILLTVILLITVSSAFAQSKFLNVPGDTITATISPGIKKILDIKQYATGSDTLFLAWQQVSVNLPVQWSGSICDNGNCYDSLHVSGMMFPVYPGDYGLMSLHIKASNVAGTAMIKYAVWNIKQPTEIDTLTWIITAFPTGIDNHLNAEPEIYSYGKKLTIRNLHLSSTYTVKIYDITGRMIYRQKINDNINLDLSWMDSGIYIVNLSGNQMATAKKIFIGQ